jgi:hypothetical protein
VAQANVTDGSRLAEDAPPILVMRIIDYSWLNRLELVKRLTEWPSTGLQGNTINPWFTTLITIFTSLST